MGFSMDILDVVFINVAVAGVGGFVVWLYHWFFRGL